MTATRWTATKNLATSCLDLIENTYTEETLNRKESARRLTLIKLLVFVMFFVDKVKSESSVAGGFCVEFSVNQILILF